MTRINEHLETVDMSKDGVAQSSMFMLVNHVMQSLANHRKAAASSGIPVQMDSSIMSALVVAAGCIHGELVAAGMVEDNIGEDDMRTMLVGNFLAGSDAGRAKVERLKAERDLEQATKQ